MTFDEAIEELRLAIPEKFYSPTLHDIAVMVEAQTKVINLLRKEYAPTILLTKNQYRELKAGHTLEEKIARIQRLTDNSSDESADSYINDDMIMRSYLHPETVKVVDE